MKRRKFHISPLLLLGLAALLTVGCLMAAVGISFARYRTDVKAGIHFRPDKTAQICLGYVAEDGSFLAQQSSWVTVDETLRLSFAVSNGSSASAFSAVDQQTGVRLIASLGAWQANGAEAMTLTVGNQVYTATAQRITEGSALYAQFGDGWVFRFLDAEGREPSWTLPGGSFSCTEMLLQVSAAAISDTSLLQLQVIGT